MLILRRKEGQWVEITHYESGDTIRIRVCNIRSRYPGQLDLAFDDPDHHFAIQRPERGARAEAPAAAEAPAPAEAVVELPPAAFAAFDPSAYYAATLPATPAG